MSSKESFLTIKPESHALKGKIAYYYFHQITDPDFSRSFTYYPNYRTALNIFKNSEIHWDDCSRYTSPSRSQKLTTIITFTRSKERLVHMNGCIQKIGVIFEPLGLNYFVNKPMKEVISETVSHFTEYSDEVYDLAGRVFSEKELKQKRNLLDRFFLEKHNNLLEPKIIEAVQLIMQTRGAMKVEDLAKSLFLSRKTLLRLFRKHLCATPMEFMKLVKFRNSIQYFKNFKGNINLSQLAYQSNYYDQSSFIKHFYSATGINPRKFFYHMEDLDNPETIWNIRP